MAITMEGLINRLHFLREGLFVIQRRLDFEDWDEYPQFYAQRGLGRVALLACGLGSIWGIHGVLLLVLTLSSNSNDGSDDGMLAGMLSPERLAMAWQWCFYVWAMCSFHLLEFFTTAVYNPSVTSGDSFLVNHSKAYTAAALIAATEFGFKFLFLPTRPHVWLVRIGVLLLFASQTIRTLSMKTCGESFNHLIQTSKKDNHVLITRGVYSIFRHPSYVGFYYWSISTQLVLQNYLSAILFAVASWMFFRRRIPYEEESLLELFPEEYPAYAKVTWVGIPFIPNFLDQVEMLGGVGVPKEEEEEVESEKEGEGEEHKKKS
jgi:protein-S-isoprenylcysteine O-methyltransferase